jgi:uncharacterized membrane protein
MLVSFLAMGSLPGPIVGALLAVPTAVLVGVLLDEFAENEPSRALAQTVLAAQRNELLSMLYLMVPISLVGLGVTAVLAQRRERRGHRARPDRGPDGRRRRAAGWRPASAGTPAAEHGTLTSTLPSVCGEPRKANRVVEDWGTLEKPVTGRRFAWPKNGRRPSAELRA